MSTLWGIIGGSIAGSLWSISFTLKDLVRELRKMNGARREP